uniref:hypothetical protein n=1 Tax=Streptomyces polyasparticus TaxID=2767826 RepID=UPI001F46EE13|nr:hypothetical protein [Streptomyces polyasparticus]
MRLADPRWWTDEGLYLVGQLVDGGAVDGDLEDRPSARAVVANLQLEGIVEVALRLDGKCAEASSDFWKQIQEFGVGARGVPCGVVGVEFVLEPGSLAFHLVEAFADGSAVRGGDVRVGLVDVGELVHKAALLGLELADLCGEGLGAVGEKGLGLRPGVGELGGEQFLAMWAEDPVGEEVVDRADERLLADPHALGVGGKPGGASVVGRVDLAGVEGQAFAALAVHAPVTQVTDDVRTQRIGAFGLRVLGVGPWLGARALTRLAHR